MASVIASAADRGEVRAIAAMEAGNSAEHQPPFRPLAPKPATSLSRTTIRSDGSACAR